MNKFNNLDDFQSSLMKHKCQNKKYESWDSPKTLEIINVCNCGEKFIINRNDLFFNSGNSKLIYCFETLNRRKEFNDLMAKY